MSFKDKLRSLRKEKGLSRKDLGQLAGISHRTIEKYEQGTRNPGLEAMMKLATALKVSPRVLFETFSQYEELIDTILELESLD